MRFLESFSIVKFVITILILIFFHPVIAQEKVKISNEEHFKILENKWECELFGGSVTGTKAQLTIESPATMKAITGRYKFGYCPSEEINFNGNVVKGKLIIVLEQLPEPCAENLHVTLSMFKNSDESYSIKGRHKWRYLNGYSGRYKSTCVQALN